MRFLTHFLFLTSLILTAVLAVGNWSYRAEEFFFLATVRDQTLMLPFLGFAALGWVTGIFFVLSLRYMFAGPAGKAIDLPAEDEAESLSDDNTH